jgi:hypothetical protein
VLMSGSPLRGGAILDWYKARAKPLDLKAKVAQWHERCSLLGRTGAIG